jgi:pimeloyl-ACP methyl ester carboxylesterase
VIDALKDEVLCLAFDQRGHGESVRPAEYTFELLEDDLRAFVEHFGLDRFVLVAHSMGGSVGWIYAGKTPERLAALIVEDTAVPINGDTYPVVAPEPPEPVSYDWEARRQLFSQLNSPDPSWSANLTRIAVPTLVIDGSRDEELAAITDALSHGEHMTIEVGHWVHETAPERFIEAVRSFLNRVELPGPTAPA